MTDEREITIKVNAKGLASVRDDMITLAARAEKLATTLPRIESGLDSINGKLLEMRYGFEDANFTVNVSAPGLDAIVEKINTLTEGIKSIDSNTGKASKKLSNLDTQVNTLATNLTTLTNNFNNSDINISVSVLGLDEAENRIDQLIKRTQDLRNADFTPSKEYSSHETYRTPVETPAPKPPSNYRRNKDDTGWLKESKDGIFRPVKTPPPGFEQLPPSQNYSTSRFFNQAGAPEIKTLLDAANKRLDQAFKDKDAHLQAAYSHIVHALEDANKGAGAIITSSGGVPVAASSWTKYKGKDAYLEHVGSAVPGLGKLHVSAAEQQASSYGLGNMFVQNTSGNEGYYKQQGYSPRDGRFEVKSIAQDPATRQQQYLNELKTVKQSLGTSTLPAHVIKRMNELKARTLKTQKESFAAFDKDWNEVTDQIEYEEEYNRVFIKSIPESLKNSFVRIVHTHPGKDIGNIGASGSDLQMQSQSFLGGSESYIINTAKNTLSKVTMAKGANGVFDANIGTLIKRLAENVSNKRVIAGASPDDPKFQAEFVDRFKNLISDIGAFESGEMPTDSMTLEQIRRTPEQRRFESFLAVASRFKSDAQTSKFLKKHKPKKAKATKALQALNAMEESNKKLLGINSLDLGTARQREDALYNSIDPLQTGERLSFAAEGIIGESNEVVTKTLIDFANRIYEIGLEAKFTQSKIRSGEHEGEWSGKFMAVAPQGSKDVLSDQKKLTEILNSVILDNAKFGMSAHQQPHMYMAKVNDILWAKKLSTYRSQNLFGNVDVSGMSGIVETGLEKAGDHFRKQGDELRKITEAPTDFDAAKGKRVPLKVDPIIKSMFELMDRPVKGALLPTTTQLTGIISASAYGKSPRLDREQSKTAMLFGMMDKPIKGALTQIKTFEDKLSGYGKREPFKIDKTIQSLFKLMDKPAKGALSPLTPEPSEWSQVTRSDWNKIDRGIALWQKEIDKVSDKLLVGFGSFEAKLQKAPETPNLRAARGKAEPFRLDTKIQDLFAFMDQPAKGALAPLSGDLKKTEQDSVIAKLNTDITMLKAQAKEARDEQKKLADKFNAELAIAKSQENWLAKLRRDAEANVKRTDAEYIQPVAEIRARIDELEAKQLSGTPMSVPEEVKALGQKSRDKKWKEVDVTDKQRFRTVQVGDVDVPDPTKRGVVDLQDLIDSPDLDKILKDLNKKSTTERMTKEVKAQVGDTFDPTIGNRVKNMGSDMYKTMDALGAKTGLLGRASWAMTSLAMSSLGVFFSIQGLVMMMQRGIGMILGPLANAESLMQSYAYAQMMVSEGGNDMNEYLNQLGINLDDVVRGSLRYQSVLGQLSFMLGAFGAKLMLDPTAWTSIQNILKKIGEFLSKPETLNMVKDMITALEKSLPGILDMVEKISWFASAVVIPIAPVLAYAWAITTVIEPMISIASWITTLTKGTFSLIGFTAKWRQEVALLNKEYTLSYSNMGATGAAQTTAKASRWGTVGKIAGSAALVGGSALLMNYLFNKPAAAEGTYTGEMPGYKTQHLGSYSPTTSGGSYTKISDTTSATYGVTPEQSSSSIFNSPIIGDMLLIGILTAAPAILSKLIGQFGKVRLPTIATAPSETSTLFSRLAGYAAEGKESFSLYKPLQYTEEAYKASEGVYATAAKGGSKFSLPQLAIPELLKTISGPLSALFLVTTTAFEMEQQRQDVITGKSKYGETKLSPLDMLNVGKQLSVGFERGYSGKGLRPGENMLPTTAIGGGIGALLAAVAGPSFVAKDIAEQESGVAFNRDVARFTSGVSEMEGYLSPENVQLEQDPSMVADTQDTALGVKELVSLSQDQLNIQKGSKDLLDKVNKYSGAAGLSAKSQASMGSWSAVPHAPIAIGGGGLYNPPTGGSLTEGPYHHPATPADMIPTFAGDTDTTSSGTSLPPGTPTKINIKDGNEYGSVPLTWGPTMNPDGTMASGGGSFGAPTNINGQSYTGPDGVTYYTGYDGKTYTAEQWANAPAYVKTGQQEGSHEYGNTGAIDSPRDKLRMAYKMWKQSKGSVADQIFDLSGLDEQSNEMLAALAEEYNSLNVGIAKVNPGSKQAQEAAEAYLAQLQEEQRQSQPQNNATSVYKAATEPYSTGLARPSWELQQEVSNIIPDQTVNLQQTISDSIKQVTEATVTALAPVTGIAVGGVSSAEALTSPLSTFTTGMARRENVATTANVTTNHYNVSVNINGSATKEVTDDMIRKIKAELFGFGV